MAGLPEKPKTEASSNPREVAEKINQARARVAEIDLSLEYLTNRRKRLTDWLAKQNVKPSLLLQDESQAKDFYSEAFSEVWELYASATGRRVEKRAAYARFKKIPALSYPQLKKAIQNYGRSREVKRGFSKHFMRFLKDDYWPDWINREPEPMDEEDKKSARQAAQEAIRGR